MACPLMEMLLFVGDGNDFVSILLKKFLILLVVMIIGRILRLVVCRDELGKV